MAEPLLEVKDLYARFETEDGVVKAVNGVNLSIEEGAILGLVGESGSGKTTTAHAILRLLAHPGRIENGQVLYRGRDVLQMEGQELRDLRGKEIGIVFQDASTALNPVISVGQQIEESLSASGEHRSTDRMWARAREVFQATGLPDPVEIRDRYPFQLSGGMAQRLMLALALAPSPSVLIADEPTSNLDVTLQAEILYRLRRFVRQEQHAVLLITHNMGVIARMADEVAVMYGGTIVEYTTTTALFNRPLHPYTWALFRTLPRMDQPDRALFFMDGQPPDLMELPEQCPFLPRCPKATNTCRLNPRPPLEETEEDHRVACYNPIDEGPARTNDRS